MKPTRTWVLIADGARARILENDGPNHGLTAIEGSNSTVIIPRRTIWYLIERDEASAHTVMGAPRSMLVPTLTGNSRQSLRINWRAFWLKDSSKSPSIGSLSLRRLSHSEIFGRHFRRKLAP
jgi:hypothetical protein